MIFIDWLSIHQDHEIPLPVVGKSWLVETDCLSGEVVFKMVKGFQHEGSFSTSLRVRCDGQRVEVSGNPSAFGQRDNVFGLPSMSACVDVYNGVLRSLGLPIFDGESIRPALRRLARTDGGLLKDGGPVVTRVDLTQNLASGDVSAVIRHLSGYTHHGLAGHLYPNGRTVDWNGSTKDSGASKRVYVKGYDKAAELDSKVKEAAKAGDLVQYSYLTKLRQWVKEAGVLRWEVSIKAKQLNKLGLQNPARWTVETMGEVIRPYQFFNKVRLEVGNLANVKELLIAEGYRPSDAARGDAYWRAWYTGYDLKANLSKSAFYRARSMLLKVGVDISNVCDIAHIPLPVRETGLKLVPLDPPEWYRTVA